ncbi:hypothetical protein E2C01_042536 [Portunus trituberculatus]|uniref:Uncharacterized protein n=1 Tax=Portunus trituberculatus TaxID=210409 RepID=A0A5B7FUY0_PORTR|nr:hypothetical protein [Portunus trituberculatus]
MTLPENLGTMQKLFERSQQIQQMFTHMSTMVRGFTEEATAHDQWGLMCRQLDILEDGISDHPRLRYLVAAYSGLAKQELCSCQELEDPKEGY